MEHRTINALHAMFCSELDDIIKQGITSHETLDIVKDLLMSEKNLMKIEWYQKQNEEQNKK